MRIYEDYLQSPDGWNVSATLTLEENGHFSYSEGWTDYTNASLSGGASGTWQRGVGAIIFRAEWAEGPMYFPWKTDGQLIAMVHDGGEALEFGHGWTLRRPLPPGEYIIETPVSNSSGTEPLTIRLEPWGIRHTLAPGEKALIVAKGCWTEGKPTVENGAGELVFYGRNGSWATFVPEASSSPPTPPKTPVSPPSRITKVTKPAQEEKNAATDAASPPRKTPVKPPVKPPPKTRAAGSSSVAPFKPRAPSPRLAALLRQWIDEMETEGPGNRVRQLCKEYDALPLDGNQLDLWALRTDGQVLYIDHESFAQRVEPETDAEMAYAVIARGAETRPELSELLPPERRKGRRGE